MSTGSDWSGLLARTARNGRPIVVTGSSESANIAVRRILRASLEEGDRGWWFGGELGWDGFMASMGLLVLEGGGVMVGGADRALTSAPLALATSIAVRVCANPAEYSWLIRNVPGAMSSVYPDGASPFLARVTSSLLTSGLMSNSLAERVGALDGRTVVGSQRPPSPGEVLRVPDRGWGPDTVIAAMAAIECDLDLGGFLVLEGWPLGMQAQAPLLSTLRHLAILSRTRILVSIASASLAGWPPGWQVVRLGRDSDIRSNRRAMSEGADDGLRIMFSEDELAHKSAPPCVGWKPGQPQQTSSLAGRAEP